MEVQDLKQDKRNYRIHNDRNLSLIKKSIDDYGFGRSIVIDSENGIIAGNGVASQIDKNTKLRVIETDGSELVVVKRTDLKTEDEKRKGLAVMENSSSDSSGFDNVRLKEDFTDEQLESMGVDIEDVPEIDVEDDTYTNKINIPQYQVNGENPLIDDLFDDTKQKILLEKIENSKLPEKEKEFLKYASYRHIVFNYHNIAEFYARASKECQELMEDSALVIIDYEDAIKNGYTTLSAKIQEVFEDG